MINYRPSVPFLSGTATDTLPSVGEGRCYSSEATYREALEDFLRKALEATHAGAGYVMLFNASETHLATEFAATQSSAFDFPRRLAVGESLEGQVSITATAATVPAPANRTNGKSPVHSSAENDSRYWTQAHCTPLLASASTQRDPQVIGTLTLVHRRRDCRFDARDAQKAALFASLMATAVVNQRAFTAQRAALMDSLCHLIENLEAKSPMTVRHSQHVAALCGMIAERLQLPEMAQAELRQGALLHEIGMLGIPEVLVHKPDRLTDAEYAQLQQHTVIGYEICKPLGFSEQMLCLIRNHHEHLDGSGYPDHLRSSQLPLSLRIICVADAFDAMSSYRPYRDRMSTASILEQLNRFSGSQFDPVVVETLKDLMTGGHLNVLYGLEAVP
ncbi:MAG TPA: HD-GYP domain-containing protein [Chthonomonadaceae bacterium]|nr:HD-GYP domain-containing protein [Chthonomonadaceae bacterium]